MGDLAAVCYVDLCRAATYVSKDDMAPIRQVVPDVENELIEKLFDGSSSANAQIMSNNLGVYIDHRHLMADCIATMFRLDTEKTIKSLIPICFDNGAPIIYKMSFVKAALSIASEENRLPWITSISTLYKPLCARIRNLFLESFNRDYRDTSSISSKKATSNNTDKRNSKKETRPLTHEKSALILDILKLYQVDPNMAVLVI